MNAISRSPRMNAGAFACHSPRLASSRYFLGVSGLIFLSLFVADGAAGQASVDDPGTASATGDSLSGASNAVRSDTVAAPVFHLDEVVVVADRVGIPVREAVAATTLLTRHDLEALPVANLPDVLRTVPGIVFVDRDGSGRLPMAITRGFFGGGETSYVLLTIDGVPVNDDRTGLVEWRQIPLSDIERIEVLRGAASVAYGDAALGAVVNVVTRGAGFPADDGSHEELATHAGSWGGRGIRGSLSRPWEGGTVRTALDVDGQDGFREHSQSDRATGSLSYARGSVDGNATLSTRLSFGHLTEQEPGPLLPDALARNRRQSAEVFDGDRRRRDLFELAGGGTRTWTAGRRLDGNLRLRYFSQERTRTLLLTPAFGDTQRQDDRDLGLWGRVQYATPLLGFEFRVGGESDIARYRTRYEDPGTGARLSQGEGTRLKLAAHGELIRDLGPRLKAHAGVRYDRVRSNLNAMEGRPSLSASFHRWSPRVALNYAYSTRPDAPGNLFVTWTQAFKAPTLDQLYDTRGIPTGEPGQTISFSNQTLKPQRSSGFEVGLYQRIGARGSPHFAELSLSVYGQKMDDEIDFDIRTFQYGNILKSQHTGMEASVRAVLSPRLEIDHAATLTRATFRSSEYDGNQLKNIPETSFVTSARAGLPQSLAFSVTHRWTSSVYLDDANTSKLPGSSIVDAALSWRRGSLEATVAARNLLDKRYQSFGYLLFDPYQQADVRMIHPGAGRALSVGLTVRSR